MSTVTIDRMASVVSRAATDSAFRAELLGNPAAALQSAGVSVPSGAKVRIVEAAQNARYVVVPSRPSDVSDADLATVASESLPTGSAVEDSLARYSQLVAASWTDSALRSKLLSNPAAVLSAHGITVPSGVTLHAVESSPDDLVLAIPPTAATSASSMTVGDLADSITGTFTALTKLVTAGSYLAGLAFSIGAIAKFKQHKDNPTQVPVGTPIAFIFIGAVLLFLPSILGVVGQTMFGNGSSNAS